MSQVRPNECQEERVMGIFVMHRGLKYFSTLKYNSYDDLKRVFSFKQKPGLSKSNVSF